MRPTRLTLLLLSALLTPACIHVDDDDWDGWDDDDDGAVVEDTRSVGAFHAVRVDDGLQLQVQVEPGASPTVTVRAEEDDLDLVRTEVEGGVLLATVRFHTHWPSGEGPTPRVVLTVPALERVERSEGGRVEVRGLAGGAFELLGSGGGDVLLAGSVDVLRADVSGGTELYARDLAAREATLVTSGGGDVQARVSEVLRVRASGGGDVRVVGSPQVLERELSGGSTLTLE